MFHHIVRLRNHGLVSTFAMSGALAQNLEITSLGSHAGELCARDRATGLDLPRKKAGERIHHGDTQQAYGHLSAFGNDIVVPLSDDRGVLRRRNIGRRRLRRSRDHLRVVTGAAVERLDLLIADVSPWA